MCGIFGAPDLKTYESIYTANCDRGNFAGGSMYVADDGSIYLKKWEGKLAPECITGEFVWSREYTLYLGHTQAPTSANREYTPSTTHPFEHGWFIVAHNGVLENSEQIREDYLKDATGDVNGTAFNTTSISVDSAIIPALLDELYVGDDVLVIKEAFSMLKGTFACWVYSKHTRHTYLVRSGSTLFGEYNNSIFSSIRVPEVAETELPEGVIFCVTREGLTEVGNFSTKSPFFII